jgi:hypothetical protein
MRPQSPIGGRVAAIREDKSVIPLRPKPSAGALQVEQGWLPQRIAEQLTDVTHPSVGDHHGVPGAGEPRREETKGAHEEVPHDAVRVNDRDAALRDPLTMARRSLVTVENGVVLQPVAGRKGDKRLRDRHATATSSRC